MNNLLRETRPKSMKNLLKSEDFSQICAMEKKSRSGINSPQTDFIVSTSVIFHVFSIAFVFRQQHLTFMYFLLFAVNELPVEPFFFFVFFAIYICNTRFFSHAKLEYVRFRIMAVYGKIFFRAR